MSLKLKLKINAKSLVAESKIIRQEERKLLANRRGEWLLSYNSIHAHRVKNVRGASRVSNLVRAFLSGIPYRSIEATRKPEKESEFQTYTLPSALDKLKRHGVRNSGKDFMAWIEAE